jgi:tellurite resistance protein TehA-like permease
MWHGCARRSGMPRSRSQIQPMDGTPRYIVMAALVAVGLVLLAGLWNMLRGTNPNLSQTLMRWRVGLQFLAIVIMMLLVYLLRP